MQFSRRTCIEVHCDEWRCSDQCKLTSKNGFESENFCKQFDDLFKKFWLKFSLVFSHRDTCL